jgi:hypothetical protein
MICVNKAPPVEAVAWIPELHERRLSSLEVMAWRCWLKPRVWEELEVRFRKPGFTCWSDQKQGQMQEGRSWVYIFELILQKLELLTVEE